MDINCIKGKRSGLMVLITVVIICFFIFGLGGFLLGRQSLPNSTRGEKGGSSPSPVSNQIESTTDWEIYQNIDVSFRYPLEWIEEPILIRGSGYVLEFRDPGNKFILSFSTYGNYNQITGKPYSSIDDYINMPYRVKTVTVDGQDARQPLPRAGSENVNSVQFFSKDSKFIYQLQLQVGEYAVDVSEGDISEGQRLFKQIIKSFKFSY